MHMDSVVDQFDYTGVVCVEGYRGWDWNRFWNTEGLDGHAKEFALYFVGIEELIKILSSNVKCTKI